MLVEWAKHLLPAISDIRDWDQSIGTVSDSRFQGRTLYSQAQTFSREEPHCPLNMSMHAFLRQGRAPPRRLTFTTLRSTTAVLPLAEADVATKMLRFTVGTRVECNCPSDYDSASPDDSNWEPGTVVKLFYREPHFPAGFVAPYQIKLDDGTLIYAPDDQDGTIRQCD